MSVPTPDHCGATTVLDGKTIACVLPPGHDDTLHQGPDGGWWLANIDTPPGALPASSTAGSNDQRFEGHADRECGEHRTVGRRAWCLHCQEWCYPEVPCRGCELPTLRKRADRAEAALAGHKAALLDALGMDPLRDWDDILNAARCLRRQRDEATTRCPSCDHLVSIHQPGGCRFTVTTGSAWRNLVCPCSKPRADLDKPETPDV